MEMKTIRKQIKVLIHNHNTDKDGDCEQVT